MADEFNVIDASEGRDPWHHRHDRGTWAVTIEQLFDGQPPARTVVAQGLSHECSDEVRDEYKELGYTDVRQENWA